MTDDRYPKFFRTLLGEEGGLSNQANDKGGLTNFGITQVTYDDYMKKQGLKPKSVKKITREEAGEIYKTYFSVVPYIENEFAHYLMFDLCVNSGPGNMRKCVQEVKNPHDPVQILTWRRQFYRGIVKAHPDQAVFLQGWLNRLISIEGVFK